MKKEQKKKYIYFQKEMYKPQSIYIIINSADRTYGTSANFEYNLDKYSIAIAAKYKINKITIPFSFYSIKTQTFQISINGGAFQAVTFAGGNYTANQLAIYLQGQINAVSAQPIAIVYNQAQNTYTFTMPAAQTIQFNFSQSFTNNYNLGSSIGLNAALFGPFNSTTGALANLSATSNLYLKSAALRSGNTSYFRKQPNTVIQSVPVVTGPNNYIVWQNAVDVWFPLSNTILNSMDIKLVDDFDNILDLNGQEFSFEIELMQKGEY